MYVDGNGDKGGSVVIGHHDEYTFSSSLLKVVRLLRSPIDLGTNPRTLEENYLSYNGKIQNVKIFLLWQDYKAFKYRYTCIYTYADTHVGILDSVI